MTATMMVLLGVLVLFALSTVWLFVLVSHRARDREVQRGLIEQNEVLSAQLARGREVAERLMAENAALRGHVAHGQATEQALLSERASLRAQLARFSGIVDLEAALAQLDARRQHQHQTALDEQAGFEQRRAEIEAIEKGLLADVEKLEAELAAVEEQHEYIEHGFYRLVYEFGASEQYQARLEQVRAKQKAMIKNSTAGIGRTDFTVNGNKAQGRKLIKDKIKLMMRAFNGECDAATLKVRSSNIIKLQERIRKSFVAINRLGSVNDCTLSEAYFELKLDELQLAYEYQLKRQAEVEEQRRIREQMREEERAQRELDKAQQDAENEAKRYTLALERARAELGRVDGARQAALQHEIEALQQRLVEAEANKERAISRAQMTRSGHVYIISNIGSFGDAVYKIGMTRRLEPMDRVRELGDASVPFMFDVHAMIYSENAPELENRLHRTFSDRRLNRVNTKREFFHVELHEIEAAMRELDPAATFTRVAEAVEFRQSLAEARALGLDVHIPRRTSVDPTQGMSAPLRQLVAS